MAISIPLFAITVLTLEDGADDVGEPLPRAALYAVCLTSDDRRCDR